MHSLVSMLNVSALAFSMNITYTIKSNMVLLYLFYVFWMSET